MLTRSAKYCYIIYLPNDDERQHLFQMTSPTTSKIVMSNKSSAG